MSRRHQQSGARLRQFTLPITAAAAVMLAGCGEERAPEPNRPAAADPMEDVPMSLTVESRAFQDNQPIPVKYTGDGDDVSPPLSWSGAPAETREFALICDDPDAPSADPWVHWVIYGIPGDDTSLPEGVPPVSRVSAPITALQGKNSWSSGRTTGYRGPAPPPGHGVHHYHFQLYALDAELNLAPNLSKPQLLAAIQPHVLAAGELVGTYLR